MSYASVVSEPAIVPADAPSMRLLVVDDDPVHSIIIKAISEKRGFEVVQVGSYEDACARLNAHEDFAGITLDLRLGERDGRELLDIVAQTNKATPIIVVSGADESDSDDARAIAGRLGLNLVLALSKPLDIARLRGAIDGLKTTHPAS